MSKLGAGRLVFACVLGACTHDFDAFEPAGPSAGDGGSSDSAAVDSGRDSSTTDVAPPDAPPDAPSGCSGSDGITFDGHCYFLTPQASWTTSRDVCSAAGAHLVTIASTAEQGALAVLAPTQDRWIGLSRPTGSPPRDASYVWITGEARVYSNWESGEPSGSGECVRMRPSGQWNDSSCSMSFAAICERD
jgi:hypothetical protein